MKSNRPATRRVLWLPWPGQSEPGPCSIYLAIRQANSTTTAPAAAVMTDVTSPPRNKQHSDVISDEGAGDTY